MSQDPPTPPQDPSTDEAISEAEKGFKARLSQASLPSKIALGIGAFGALFFIGLVIALFVGLVLGESAAVADTVAVIRDLFIILLAMQGLLISLALVILVLQVAALLNLFQNEIKPILQDLQETAQTVKGTSAFVKENVTAPLIETQAWMAGVSTFITRLNPFRADRAEAQASDEPEPEAETPNEAQAPDEPKAEAETPTEAQASDEPQAEAETEAMPSAELKPETENLSKTQDSALPTEDDKNQKVDDDAESAT